MPFQIIRNDISRVSADVIVNTANPLPIIGEGTDSTIHAAAGPQLLKAREAIGVLRPGDAAMTPGFNLPADYVIHTVGPVWRGGLMGEERILRRCYARCLRMAWEKGCASIAFPLISTGTYGFPQEKALQIARDVIREFLQEREMLVYLVVFNREAFRLSETLYRNVASYIDEQYVQDLAQEHYHAPAPGRGRNRFDLGEYERRYVPKETQAAAEPVNPEWYDALPMAKSATEEAAPRSRTSRRKPQPAAQGKSLSQWLEQTDAGFSETLLQLIQRTGKKDSEIYNKANISRQHFSKIRKNPAYTPTKATAVAFAIALELDLEQTRDLIGRAGYALTRSSKFDLIIMYFIEKKNYDLYDINMALFEFDQDLLGS